MNTSNAIDFKALRNSSGKILTPDNKYFYEVNRLKVNRFPVNYNISNKEILKILKVIPSYNALNLHDDALEKIICLIGLITN